jgi:integrase
MPRACKLTYNAEKGRPPRWRKFYRGKLYQWPAGKGKSDTAAYQAALAAWEAKKREIDLAEDRIHEPAYAVCLDKWEQVLSIALQHGDKAWQRRAENKIADLRRRLNETKLSPLQDEDWFDHLMFGHEEWAGEMEARLRESAPGLDVTVEPLTAWEQTQAEAAVWKDRLAQAARKAALGDSIAEHVKAFLDSREIQVNAKKLSAARLVALRVHLMKFQEWIGGATSIKEIDGPKLIKYKSELDGTCGLRTAGHRLEAAKTFTKWLWATEAIPTLPRAFTTGELRVSKAGDDGDIETFTIDEVKTLLAKASPRTKLYCLLGLNCGMYQIDIASLKRKQLDIEKGTITRRRSKTRKHKNPPRVTYRLWPQVIELLKQEVAAEGDLALIGENSRPLVVQTVDGKKTDAVRSAFNRLLKKTGIKGSFKLFRKTSASLLADSQWPDVYDLFLGLAAAKISDRHYAKAAQGRLAKALAWLGKKYGIS